MIVVLAGASGLIGTALGKALRDAGHETRKLVRHGASGRSEFAWDPERGIVPGAALEGADAVVNLAGAPVSVRWTTAGRAAILSSRIQATSTIAAGLAGLSDGPRVLVQASASGFYGDRGEEALDERSLPGDGFLAGVVRQWEAAAEPAQEAGVRVAFARTGIVLAPAGGALGRLLPLIRLGLGGPLGSGQQWWSWITLRDEVRALLHLLGSDIEGPVNLTAPHPERQRDVVRALAVELRRPATLPVPGWALRLAIGGFASEILASQRILPAKLRASGFEFRDEEIGAAARWVTAPTR